MKVAYVFAMPRSASYKLARMILPQLEAGTHGVDMVGMFFFDDNNFVLHKGDPVGERLAKVAADKGMLLMMCDMCALERNLAEGEPRWCVPDGTVALSLVKYTPLTQLKAFRSAIFPICMPHCQAIRLIR